MATGLDGTCSFKDVAAFCSRFGIAELSVFGSCARGTATPESDLDVVIAPKAGMRWSLLDLAEIREELSLLCQRNVDLLTRKAVEQSGNPFLRQEILGSSVLVYEAS